MNQFCFVICGPSGVGKTTLVEAILSHFDDIEISVSYTTRKPRGEEVDATHYHFVEDEKFDEMIESNSFAEWAEVHGNRYGTSQERVEEIWAQHKNVLFDIDYQGANQLKEVFGTRTISVLVVPPSLSELERRLRGRATDSEETILRRMRNAKNEISHFEDFDFVLINKTLDEAEQKIKTIYMASTHKTDFWGKRINELLKN